MSSWLQEYVVFVATKGRVKRSKRGRDPLANLVRNFVIEEAIDWVCARFGLKPTRNPATNVDCGSSIVAMALEGSGADMSEANVAAIWAKLPSHELGDRRHERRALKTSEASPQTDEVYP
jgi:hypothetical protein